MSGADAVFVRALAAHQAGNLAEAGTLYRRVLESEPRHAEALRLLGLVALVSGDAPTAVRLISESARLVPRNPETQAQLGLALKAAGRAGEAASHLETARRLAPEDAEILVNLTAALRAAGRIAEGARRARQSVALAPALPPALLNLGNLGYASAILRALRVRPDYVEAWINLGNARVSSGDPEGARGAFQSALVLNPYSLEALTNLGALLLDLDKVESARFCHRRVVALAPGDAGGLGNLGLVAKAAGRIGEAIAWHRRALAIRRDAGAFNSLGDALQARGDGAAASGAYRQAVALGASASWHSNLIFCLCYEAATTNDGMFAATRDWADRHAPKGRRKPPRRAMSARPKIGVLSSDLRDHPVGRNVLGLFEHHQRVDLHAYAEVSRGDETTARFKAHAEGWVSTVGMSDEDVAERMRRDGIDLLIVLAGHTARNRPLVAAFGAAPVQVSFHDLTTSGLEAMDWWVTDAALHPEGTRERFSERLWRLPHFYLHRPPDEAPEVGGLPCEERGGVTFVSCNNPAKLTPEVVRLWSRVLAAVPGSRLMLKYVGWFSDPAVRGRFVRLFGENGVAPDRLDFRGRDLRRSDQLALLSEADVALDPFPFNGSTTSFEALWMGVPVVTLAGERFVGRVGASVLTALGQEALIATDEADYIQRAVALAEDRTRLALLRRTLRPTLAASPLCDAPGYTRIFEDALLGMLA